MNRVELKNKAKEMIRGNKWFIWKPLIIIGLAIGVIEGIAFGLDSALGLTTTSTVEIFGTKVTNTSGGIISAIVGIFTGFAGAAFSVGYAKYMISFVRGEKLELKDIIEFMKKHWVVAFLTSLIVGLNIVIGTILFIVPGMIASFGFIFYQEVCAENPELKVMEIVHKSWAITKGHKMDLFVMGLSFIGWILLAPFTLGILYIWLMPYILVTLTLAYEELRK